MENNIIRINNLDCPIYRIYQCDRFLDLIETRTDALISPSKWEDPWENFLFKNNVVGNNGEVISIEPLYKSFYGQCWTMNCDSDAIWRIYSKNRSGIRVSTTVGKLLKNYWQVGNNPELKYLIGAVEYKDRQEMQEFARKVSGTGLDNYLMGGSLFKFAETFLMKREGFSHEREVRMIFCEDSNENIGVCGIAKFAFNLDMLDEVALDPRLKLDEFERRREKIIKKSGYTKEIVQSDLYQPMGEIKIKLSAP